MTNPNHRKSLGIRLKTWLSDPYFQGLTALLGLIALIVSGNLVIRSLAVFILLWGLFSLRSEIWHVARISAIWLTWKFILGIAVGILIGATFFPFFEAIYKHGVSYFIPQVEVLETFPKDNETLPNLYDSVEINFSERIPSKYRSFVKVEITPDIPLKRVWVYDFDPSDCCRTLYIESARYFANSPNPQFEPDTIYHLKISGPLIKNPLEIEFHTGSK